CLEGVCYQLSEIDCDTYSGSFHAGKDCEDVECENPNSFDSGACCVGTACVEVTYDTCTSYSNGQFMGAGTTCYGEMAVDCNNNDPIAPGACCVGTDCFMTDVLTCVSWSGQFLGHGTSCDNNPCDDAGGDLTGACCSADGTCTIKSEALCLESGSTFIGGQCGPITCDNYSKECECILLQGILDNNRKILLELLDQGHTLEESLYVLNLIQQNTFNTAGMMEMQITLMDHLVMDQIPTIIEILETLINPDGTPSHLDTPYDSANQETDAFSNMTDSNNDLLYMFTKEGGGDMFGLSEITDDLRRENAPVYSLEGSALSVSFLGQNTTLSENFEFDFSLLDDWGVRTIIRVVIVLLFSWWSVQMIWQETRRQ
ncbi:MAG: hypothetical protein QF535_09740, partial [Anaerolineales bacterium]|nr:hypothetical protein [Anaerolineales bacterium]